MKRTWMAVVVVLLVIGVLLLGCASSSSTTEQKTTTTKKATLIKLKDVISAEEVTQLAGYPAGKVEDKSKNDGSGQERVLWWSADNTQFVMISMVQGSTAKSAYEAIKGTSTTVTGLGDDAYQEGAALGVLSGNYFFQINTNLPSNDPKTMDIEKAIAAKLIEKLRPRERR